MSKSLQKIMGKRGWGGPLWWPFPLVRPHSDHSQKARTDMWGRTDAEQLLERRKTRHFVGRPPTPNSLPLSPRLLASEYGKQRAGWIASDLTQVTSTVLLLLPLLLSRFSCVWLSATPQTAARQAPPSLGFSRQEHWSGLPFPSPMHESEKWKWSRSVVSDSSRPHGLQPTRLLRPWDFPGKSTGVGCHCLLCHCCRVHHLYVYVCTYNFSLRNWASSLW